MKEKINILFDALTLAENDTKTGNRSGIWFTVYNILKEFANNKNVNIYIYCSKKKFSAKLSKTLEKYFPNNNFNNFYINTLGPFEFEHSKLTCEYKEKKNKLTKLKLFFTSVLKKLFTKKTDYKKLTENIDIYFSPVYKIPDEIENIEKIKKVTILYDIIPLLYPEYFADKDMEKYWFTPVWRQLNKNDYYFAISEYTRKDFLEHFPQIDKNKIYTTLLACSESFKPEPEKTKKSLEKYNLPTDKKYIFSLCTLEPRKNLIRAAKCFIKFVEKNNITDMVFILGGGHWEGFVEKMEQEIPNFSKYKNLILKAGYIDDEDLAPLYSGAEWFVYTSEYEGFGLPPLEAMSCGCPVITSNRSSIPEVVGAAGIMIDYDSEEQHIQAYEKYYFDKDLRKLNKEKGISRAKDFTWKKCADRMVTIMQNMSN